jgi:hypothetical protein
MTSRLIGKPANGRQVDQRLRSFQGRRRFSIMRPKAGRWTGSQAPWDKIRPDPNHFARADAGTRTPDPFITSEVQGRDERS